MHGPATVMMNPDFKDLFHEFNASGVEFLVVGAHALAVHGHVRATKDLDVWIRPSNENASRVFTALTRFGAPLPTSAHPGGFRIWPILNGWGINNPICFQPGG